MAMAFIARNLIKKPNPNALPSIFCRSFTVKPNLSISYGVQRGPLLVALTTEFHSLTSMVGVGLSKRSLSTHTAATSSLRDPSPNWNNRPPKETILLDGCDFEHWLIVVENPADKLTRDEIIDSYIKKLAQVFGGNEEEARQKIYSVSTRHYFAFGCIVPEEISYKIKELPGVRWVLPDSYLDVKNKDYGGEPFINGQAVPYDPKYHEQWVRNKIDSENRGRRNKDRPRNFDRSRNFERRRENIQNNRDDRPPADSNRGGMPTPYVQNSGTNNSGMPAPTANMQNNVPSHGDVSPAPNVGYSNNMNMRNGVPNNGDVPPRPNVGYSNMNTGNGMPNHGGMAPNAGANFGYSNNMNTGSGVPNYTGVPHGDAGRNAAYPNNMNMGNNAPNYTGMPPRNTSSSGGYSNNMNSGGIPNRDAGHLNNMPPPPNRDFQSWDASNNGGTQIYQNRRGPVPNRGYQQNSYTPPPNGNMGNVPSGNVYQVRDVPGRDLPPQVPYQNYQ
ncbi:hypothetical protein AQUCO_00400329v1 [Aquilegia coerulea]|uniref:MORF/ORRM1/DAG-like MORF domain-containing protein n=1 Tax=Aquilegia coerulea TaxID=218851 RepID=A0A2G5EUE8_AQUCA|nr:hypothetical protein AQUCO_00400329v1 [Aquilegia coerulea]